MLSWTQQMDDDTKSALLATSMCTHNFFPTDSTQKVQPHYSFIATNRFAKVSNQAEDCNFNPSLKTCQSGSWSEQAIPFLI